MPSSTGTTWADFQERLGLLRSAVNGTTRDYRLMRQYLFEAGVIAMGLGESAAANGTSLQLLQQGLDSFEKQIEAMQAYDLKTGAESGRRLFKTRLSSEGRRSAAGSLCDGW